MKRLPHTLAGPRALIGPHALVSLSVAAILSGCGSAPPKDVPELDTARAIVPQVEASPRAGVAPENIANARKSLETANQLMTSHGPLEDVRYQAEVATRNAQIANEKILTAQARDDISKGQAERQQVLLQAERSRAQSLQRELQDLKAQQTDRGLVVTLGDVLFDTGKAALKPGAYTTIDKVAQILRENPARRVQIEGHTDSTGNPDFNQVLSENRAQSVQAALMERGVSGSQISAVGKGQGFPVASNSTAAGRQQNRRVEMIFSESKTPSPS